MELKTYALQWLKNHDQMKDEESSTYQRSLCIIDLFDTLEDQEQTPENLKRVLATFAGIVSSFYNNDEEDW